MWSALAIALALVAACLAIWSHDAHTTNPRPVEQLQIAMRSPDALDVPFEYAIARARECRTLGDAIKACATAGGLDLDKQVSDPLGFDKAQLSRWESGQEGIKWEKLKRVMDWCGNVIPTIWMNIRAGFDPHSLRKFETETEKENRELRGVVAALRTVLMAGAN